MADELRIVITHEVAAVLRDLKVHPREPYVDVIRRLLEGHNATKTGIPATQ